MLDDFGKSGSGGRGRFGVSLGAAVLVFGSISGAVVAASAMVRQVVLEEELVQVEFAPPPEAAPEPPPPPPPPPVEVATPPPPNAAPARLGRPRPELQQPDEIPDERPEESDAPLAPPDDPFGPEQEGDPNGTPDGQIGGVPGGTGTAIVAEPTPAPAPEPARPRGPQRVIEGSTPPQVDREEIARNFDIPSEVRTAGIARITVVVRVTVAEDGRVMRVDVLRGHPLIPNENIVRAVERSSFQPARLADGSPYSAIHTLPITIAVTL
ncbi:energy transducer TonB [Sandaracinus amylolyticus]|uniref:energy transducer TonB n=1 Tax=Sandaracinus amylolyticus TaxID=927083 RepID=UPI001F01223D|nr:energy transducer TonB [Sandaracinus amylolyticus]UJR82515.1 Hypothetical protein I5071_45800 [Sandaracinus amylolyticus]